MLRRLTILLLIVGSLFTQNLPPQSDIENMTASERMILYENHNKSIGIAMGLNLFPFPFSSIGFAYIKDWRRGLLYDAAYGINLGIIAYTYDNQILSDKQLGIMLVITNIALYTYKSYDLFKQTKQYNHNLYEVIMEEETPKICFNLHPIYQGANLTMSYALN